MASFLSKAGKRFKIDIDRIPKHRHGRWIKLQNQVTPSYARTDNDLKYFDKDSEIDQDFAKLKYLEGDQVIIVKGPRTGAICKIEQVASNGSYLLGENGPTQTRLIPKKFWVEGQTSHVLNFPKFVKPDDIRLVAYIEGDDGKLKAVAVDNLEFKEKYYDEDYKNVIPYRSVYGQPDMIIPWPRPDPQEDGPLSTKVEDVKERSYFVQSVVRDTIPEEAMLTIRNPSSKWRRGQLTKSEVRRLTPPTMPLTDVKKAYLKERSELKKLNKVNITDEMKEYLGAKIRKHEVVTAERLQDLRNSV